MVGTVVEVVAGTVVEVVVGTVVEVVAGAEVEVVAAPLRHCAVHWAPPPSFFLSDRKRTRRPFLDSLPVNVTGLGPFVPQ